MIPIHCPYCQSILIKEPYNIKYYHNGETLLCAKTEMDHFFKFTQFDLGYNKWYFFHHKTTIGISEDRLWKEDNVSTTSPDITLVSFASNLTYHQAAIYLKRYINLLAFQ